MNRSKKRVREGATAPSRQDEYLLYQTLLGTFPTEAADADALAAYRGRIEPLHAEGGAGGEAATRAGSTPTPSYEAARSARSSRDCCATARATSSSTTCGCRLRDVAWFGALNSLSMTLLKLAVTGRAGLLPGAPSSSTFRSSTRTTAGRSTIALRERHCSTSWPRSPPAATPARGCAHWRQRPLDGRAKLWVSARSLALRRRDPELFERGGYTALAASGEKAAHVVAFARQHAGRSVIVVAGRLFLQLVGDPGRLPIGAEVWQDTAIDLAPLGGGTGRFIDALTGGTVTAAAGRLALGRAFGDFPGALLQPA